MVWKIRLIRKVQQQEFPNPPPGNKVAWENIYGFGYFPQAADLMLRGGGTVATERHCEPGDGPARMVTVLSGRGGW